MKTLTLTALLAVLPTLLSTGVAAGEEQASLQGQSPGQSPGHWLLAKYDANGDARITQREVTNKKLNLFTRMDSDNNGGISFEEYERTDAVKRQALLKSRFVKLDINHDGLVTQDEYSSYMGMFSSIDRDGDGTLTAQEIGVEQAAPTQVSHCLLWFCIRRELNE
jgi:Ca2+-binding EF-hand superfamily protein